MTLVRKCTTPSNQDVCQHCKLHKQPSLWWGIVYVRNGWKFAERGYCDSFVASYDKPEPKLEGGLPAWDDEITLALR